jgi:hypothetical protein
MDKDNPGTLFGRSTRRGSFEKIMALIHAANACEPSKKLTVSAAG